ncbi:MAG TPA: hypothetical protein VF306_07350 [Pirellulales bacterium]
MSTASCLDEMLEPLTAAFTLELARRLVELRANPDLQARVDALADKANQGTLTPEEERVYKGYVEAADIIGIIQAKARRFLAT